MKKTTQGYYEKKVSLGRDSSGKLIRKSVRAKTMKELEKKVFDLKQEQSLKQQLPDNDVTFDTYARLWLTTKANKSLNTRAMYKLTYEKYIEPEIGILYFSEIDLPMLQTVINNHYDHPNTCNKIRLTLKQVYAMAAEDGLPNMINLKRLALPPMKKVVEKRTLTQEEKDAIFTADLTDQERAYVYILYFTGLRREEALALDKDAFDFDAKTVTVSKTVVFDGNRAVVNFDQAKNESSLRSVPLPASCVDVLRDYAAKCTGYLFRSTRSKLPFSRTAYQDFFNRIKKKLGSDTLTAHIFRHNYATMLYYSNISLKQAAKLMGHSSTQMIMEVYAHLDEQQEKTAEKLDKIFG
jgi:integrase